MVLAGADAPPRPAATATSPVSLWSPRHHRRHTTTNIHQLGAWFGSTGEQEREWGGHVQLPSKVARALWGSRLQQSRSAVCQYAPGSRAQARQRRQQVVAPLSSTLVNLSKGTAAADAARWELLDDDIDVANYAPHSFGMRPPAAATAARRHDHRQVNGMRAQNWRQGLRPTQVIGPSSAPTRAGPSSAGSETSQAEPALPSVTVPEPQLDLQIEAEPEAEPMITTEPEPQQEPQPQPAPQPAPAPAADARFPSRASRSAETSLDLAVAAAVAAALALLAPARVGALLVALDLALALALTHAGAQARAGAGAG
eukprot:COSAG01_NODE_13395_length_1591_cov_2.969169_1_plen_312_part_10